MVQFPDARARGRLLRKVFPDHWSCLLGELAVYSFVLMILTGICSNFFLHPSMGEVIYHGSFVPLDGVRISQAYSSTLRITSDVRGGISIRQINHWAALLFIVSLGSHLLRVFCAGAFRRPRATD